MSQESSTTILQSTASDRLYTISEAADLLGVSVPTIRMYEREGLIIPHRRRSRHRRFSTGDLERIRCLRRMINTNEVSIAGIRRLLALIPCWSIRNCPEEERKKCHAFYRYEAPCWMASEKFWECKNAECQLCPVYHHHSDCHTIKENIIPFTTPSV